MSLECKGSTCFERKLQKSMYGILEGCNASLRNILSVVANGLRNRTHLKVLWELT